jgi:hypothetical protein
MYKYIFILLLSCLSLQADVLLFEDDVIRFRLADKWQKLAGSDDQRCKYGDDQKNILLVQLFRNQKWSQWHMKGLYKSKKTFQKYFSSSFGGSSDDILKELYYNKEDYILSMEWQRADKSLFVSKLKLTSFGCIAFHMPCAKSQTAQAHAELEELALKVEIPENLQFTPEDITKEILENMGGGVAFVVMSILYLMFSLFTRSQMRSRRLERSMAEVKVRPRNPIAKTN